MRNEQHATGAEATSARSSPPMAPASTTPMPEAVTALFAWPATIWQFGEGHVFEDAEELAENVEALIDVFDEAGIISTMPDVKEVRVAGAAAFANVALAAGGRRRRAAARVHLPVPARQRGRRLAHRDGRERGTRRALSGDDATRRQSGPSRPADAEICARIFDRAWHVGHPFAPRRIDASVLATRPRARRCSSPKTTAARWSASSRSTSRRASCITSMSSPPAQPGRSAQALLRHAVAVAGGNATLKCQLGNHAALRLLPPSRLGGGRGRHERIRRLGDPAQPVLAARG